MTNPSDSPPDGTREGTAVFDSSARDGAGGWRDISNGDLLTPRQVAVQHHIAAMHETDIIAVDRPKATESEKFLSAIARGAILPGKGTEWEASISAAAAIDENAVRARLVEICHENAEEISFIVSEELAHQGEPPIPLTIAEYNDIIDHGGPFSVGPFAQPGGIQLPRLPETFHAGGETELPSAAASDSGTGKEGDGAQATGGSSARIAAGEGTEDGAAATTGDVTGAGVSVNTVLPVHPSRLSDLIHAIERDLVGAEHWAVKELKQLLGHHQTV